MNLFTQGLVISTFFLPASCTSAIKAGRKAARKGRKQEKAAASHTANIFSLLAAVLGRLLAEVVFAGSHFSIPATIACSEPSSSE